MPVKRDSLYSRTLEIYRYTTRPEHFAQRGARDALSLIALARVSRERQWQRGEREHDDEEERSGILAEEAKGGGEHAAGGAYRLADKAAGAAPPAVDELGPLVAEHAVQRELDRHEERDLGAEVASARLPPRRSTSHGEGRGGHGLQPLRLLCEEHESVPRSACGDIFTTREVQATEVVIRG